jgi:serine/threonine-protein kinase
MSNAYQVSGAAQDLFLDVVEGGRAIAAADPADHKTIIGVAGAVEAWTTPEELVGQTLAERYTLQRLLGAGGMGAVYEAEHVLIRKRVAVKVLSPEFSRNQHDVQRFLLEARAASMIHHEHVVDITDFGYTQRGQAFLVMEHLDGEDLAATLARERRLSWPRVCHIASQVTAALERAHAQGVVHRDIKPENFFRITRAKDPDFIKVLDFAIAKVASDAGLHRADDPSASMSSVGLIGTPEYIAPELLAGAEADARVDIYAIGVVMYQLLTGSTPFTGSSVMEILSQSALEEAVPPRERAPTANIPATVEAIVLRAIAREPDSRYQSAEDLREALDAALAEHRARGVGWWTWLLASRARVVGSLSLALALTLLFASVVVTSMVSNSTHSEESGAGVSTATPTTERGEPEPPLVAVADAPARASTSSADSSSGDQEIADQGESGDGSTGGGDDTDAAAPLSKRAASKRRKPSRLSSSSFRRSVGRAKRRLRARCGELGISGMKVTVEVHVSAKGRVTRVVPQGTMAGSSLAACVSSVISRTRFKSARRSSVHTTIVRI